MFLWWALCCHRVHIGHSSSSKVDDFGTSWKHVCDFLLVHHCKQLPPQTPLPVEREYPLPTPHTLLVAGVDLVPPTAFTTSLRKSKYQLSGQPEEMARFYSQREGDHSSKCKERELARHDHQHPDRAWHLMTTTMSKYVGLDWLFKDSVLNWDDRRLSSRVSVLLTALVNRCKVNGSYCHLFSWIIY